MKQKLIFIVIILAILCMGARPYISGRGDKNVGTLFAHHQIHLGNAYRVMDHQEGLGDGDTVTFLINTTGTTNLPHLSITLSSSAESLLEIWSGTTVTAVGGSQTEQNRNLISSNTSGIEITNTPTLNAIGTHLTELDMAAGSGRKAGGSWAEGEIILNRNTLYFINGISEAGSNDMTIILDWYEADDAY